MIAAGFMNGADKSTIIGGLLPGLLEASVGLFAGGPGWRNKARHLPEAARQRLAQSAIWMSTNLEVTSSMAQKLNVIMDDVRKLPTSDWMVGGLPRAFCSLKDSENSQACFRICNEALRQLGPAVTEQPPLAMLFDGSYVRIGTDLLPANIGMNEKGIIGGGCFDLDDEKDASGMDMDVFGKLASDALYGRKQVAKQLLTRSKNGE